MTVTELIKKLQLMPPDAQVETEGCDCIGQAEGVRFDGDTVLITRTMDDADRARTALLYPSASLAKIGNAEDEIEMAEEN